MKIYIDRLKNDTTQKIEETLVPDFLGVQEKDLSFIHPIHVAGEAYLADDHLVLHLSIDTIATLPCSICNQPVQTPIHTHHLYSTHPLSEIPGIIFDLAEEIREIILLQTPAFAECSGGSCPERESVKKFFTSPEPQAHEVNFPFADL
jgi:uncharacterized metal-binding protein YceD (DUF177 family)